mmetsp:Transcript_8510/g.26688  ORF Transcript_8510/g.26688 Transcript_8510/m.26688 type:complete len:203 (+) Transcript_8510:3101-3709(+)
MLEHRLLDEVQEDFEAADLDVRARRAPHEGDLAAAVPPHKVARELRVGAPPRRCGGERAGGLGALDAAVCPVAEVERAAPDMECADAADGHRATRRRLEAVHLEIVEEAVFGGGAARRRADQIAQPEVARLIGRVAVAQSHVRDERGERVDDFFAHRLARQPDHADGGEGGLEVVRLGAAQHRAEDGGCEVELRQPVPRREV